MELRHIIKQGRSVIPVDKNKQAMVAWQEYRHRFPRVDEINSWLALNPPHWAVVTGEWSKLVTLDFDSVLGLKKMRSLGLNPHRITPHGAHVDFEWSGNELLSGSGDAVDVRGENGYIIVLGDGYSWPPDYRPRRVLPIGALKLNRLRRD